MKYTDPDGKSEELGSGASNHLLVRRTDDGKHVIVDGGTQYNYVEQALINYINTEDEKYLNQVPETSDPLAVAGISAFIADYLDNNDTSNSIGSKSETIFVIAMAIAGSSGGNKDKRGGGIGSTGRTIANNLKEKLAMEQAQSSPELGQQLNVKMDDKKNGWFASDGWIKMAQNVNGIEIHYIHNTKTGIYTDFKFE
ncbi:hypothetical protein [uncultured Treponema sp.]|uniref:hypothetical protein n=1 Tax=uncultured Treponema sp. TaxID=162155 RepID=UPI0028E6953B|nr:hypothetical protein [uncultured Treponema sp.]